MGLFSKKVKDIEVVELKAFGCRPNSIHLVINNAGNYINFRVRSIEVDKDTHSFKYNTGIILAVPRGYILMIKPEINSHTHNLYMPEGFKIVNAYDKDEVSIILRNRSSAYSKSPYVLGELVAIGVLIPIPDVTISYSKLD